jgi:adenylate cyclase
MACRRSTLDGPSLGPMKSVFASRPLGPAPPDGTQVGDSRPADTAAALIHRLVAERFGSARRIGIGINTGVVIAGTIGGGGKLEFTLIGDTVNVAACVEHP